MNPAALDLICTKKFGKSGPIYSSHGLWREELQLKTMQDILIKTDFHGTPTSATSPPIEICLNNASRLFVEQVLISSSKLLRLVSRHEESNFS